jgi:hypothetical protein
VYLFDNIKKKFKKLDQSSPETYEQYSESFCSFSSGSHWYGGNHLTVGNPVTGYVTCRHTDGLDLVLGVCVAVEQGTWLHHS